ncbi:protein FAM185A [Hoplias malabaricus]|uniref:protein FAM185A n=1 Tax=Hoplias malabaricus TaxID=27720 RepID=UPI003463521E
MKYRFLYGVIRVGCVRGCLRLFPSQASRASSSSASSAVKQWSVAVSPFIRITCHLHCNISVKPLDPHYFPGADRALITVYGNRDFSLDSVHVHYDEQNKVLRINSEESSSAVSIELTTPIKSDLHVVTQGKGDVKIQNMESDLCQVQTEQGHCVLHSVKSHKVQVQSSGGNIIGLGTIHGDVDIRTTGHSSIDIKKIQGTSMNVSTEHGPLKLKAVYAQSSSLSSSSGNLIIGHLHGEAHVQTDTGGIVIDSSSGALRAVSKTGNIDVYVGQTETAELQTQQGAVILRVPATMRAGVHLCGNTVDISSEIFQETEHHSAKGKTVVVGRLNSGSEVDCCIKATADRGAVSLKTQSWLETLKLGS